MFGACLLVDGVDGIDDVDHILHGHRLVGTQDDTSIGDSGLDAGGDE